MEYSVSMALVDYIPVVCFLIGAVALQRTLYAAMAKGAFALFAAGTIDVFAAGFMKATYKLLYALGVCDFQRLGDVFFPLQSLGFLLAGLGVVSMLIAEQRRAKAEGGEGKADALLAAGAAGSGAAPAVFSGTFLFVGLMVLGLGMMDAGLMVLAKRKKRACIIVLLAVSFVCCLGMGYLSTKDFADAAMNWLAEGVNIVGQGAFLASALCLARAERD